MPDDKLTVRGPTFLAGKAVSNFGQSSIDCVIRRLTDHGATLSVESLIGFPEQFHLLIPGAGPPRPCKRAWQSDRQVGVVFEVPEIAGNDAPLQPEHPERRKNDPALRGEMLALRAALDEIEIGVVLLDATMRSQYINRAFRRMWTLPDAAADRNPAFVALMYHGRNTRAYDVPDPELDAYVAERVRQVNLGDPTPRDLRRTNGEVIRVQCAVLPNGGRLLTYTFVTDIVRHADELEALRNALDNVQDGVVLLDRDLNATFLNRQMRAFWSVTDAEAAAHPAYEALLATRPRGQEMAPDEMKAAIAKRVAAVRDGGEKVRDLLAVDGRTIREQYTLLANGDRMLTYCDVTDLVRNTERLEKLATTDTLTEVDNRRNFLSTTDAEWSRFRRYWRPLSMLVIDVDTFKSVNDRYGHATGDDVLVAVADICTRNKRRSDTVGRLGGDEFAILLPETELTQAFVFAERLRELISNQVHTTNGIQFKVTVSIGVVAAALGMTGVDNLMKAADDALRQAKSNGRNSVARWTDAAN